MHLNASDHSARNGIFAALGAFLLWGFSPLYYRAVGETPALEILAHRAIWSCLFTLALIVITKQGKTFITQLHNKRIMLTLVISAILVSVNWLGFIWGVNNGMALEASMGYFIMPIVMVILGRLFLDEQLNRNQIISMLLVLLGVLNLLFMLNQLPWLALMLAFSFGLYSLVRKMAPVNSLVGLTIECLLLAPIGLFYLVYLHQQEQLVFGQLNITLDLLLVGTALITALPLLLFTFASKRLRLGTVGLIQYLNPTCQFFLAVFLFNEPFSDHHLHTFLLIWLGLGIFSLDSHTRQRKLTGQTVG